MSSKKSRSNYLIFHKIIDINPSLKLKDLIKITGKPERTVAYWLSGDREPDSMSMYLLKYALDLAKMKIPRELARLVTALNYQPQSWAKKNRSQNKKTEYIGEKITNPPLGDYIFENKKITINEISAKTGFSAADCRRWIKRSGIEKGSDCTDFIINHKIHDKRLKNITFKYMGNYLSVCDISKKTEIKVSTLNRIIKENDIENGDDCTYLLENITRKVKKYIYVNKEMSVKQISQHSKIKESTLRTRFRVKGVNYGDDVTSLVIDKPKIGRP